MFVSSAAKEAKEPTGKSMLETLPSEVKDHIFSYLPHETLYSLLFTGSALSEAAAIQLYRRPRYRTTYRFAQFVTTVSHLRHYANMVRVFELSDRSGAQDRANGFASWREWKYRDKPFYAAQAPPKQLLEPQKKAYNGAHPGANHLFNRMDVSMPVGLVVQVLAACRHIRSCSLPDLLCRPQMLIPDRQFKLNFKALTNDDLIESLSYPPSAISGIVFGSDLAKSWTQGSADVESVQPGFLLRYLTNLPNLEMARIQNAPWLTEEDVQGILWSCPHLREVDFRHSGQLMRDQILVICGKTAKWEIPWAIKGSREECAARLPARLASESLPTISRVSGWRKH